MSYWCPRCGASGLLSYTAAIAHCPRESSKEEVSRLRAERRASGQCIHCGTPSTARLCVECRKTYAAYEVGSVEHQGPARRRWTAKEDLVIASDLSRAEMAIKTGRSLRAGQGAEGRAERKKIMPRKRKSKAEVSAARRAASLARWAGLTAEERRLANAHAVAMAQEASPVNKKRKDAGK